MRIEIRGEWATSSASERAGWRPFILAMVLASCLVGSGCLGSGQRGKADPAMQDAELRAARIEALRTSIEQDHRTLENLITQPGRAADASLHDDPELRATATRLTERERELEELTSMVSDEKTPSK